MKDFIKLTKIEKQKGTIRFCFETSGRLKSYFSDCPFLIEYPEEVESVPDAVAIVPFVCCVLPIVWLNDAQLILPTIDKSFYECIPETKKGYESMFPETTFRGEIAVEQIEDCRRDNQNDGSALFFSGGVDSVQTLISHLDERPFLISVWGSDIRYDNESGWNILHKTLHTEAERFQLPEIVIHSRFRDFDRENALSKEFSRQLKDSWWHGVKHGIALLGHVAPIAWLHGIKKMYIASSHCPEDGHVRCASNPLIDDHVRFGDCQVYHDGFEFSRQDKVHNIVNWAGETRQVSLHVCWETQTGENCCHCEKCYRTIAAILVERGDPARFGFPKYKQYLAQMPSTVRTYTDGILVRQWTKIQNRLIENKKNIKKEKTWKAIRWIEKADFTHPETIQEDLFIRIKNAKGVRAKLAEFSFYQKLHGIKTGIIKQRNKNE